MKFIIFCTLLGLALCQDLYGALIGFVFALVIFAPIEEYNLKRKQFSERSNEALINSIDKSEIGTNTRFSSQKEAGNHGEELFKESLIRLMRIENFDYISTENMLVNRSNFEIDFLMMVPKVGFIIVEVKYYAGEVFCTNQEKWKQANSQGEIVWNKSPSLQVVRTHNLFKKLMVENSMDKWPIIPVVVFTHPDAIIYEAKKPQKPQTDVLQVRMLQEWIKSLPTNAKITFSDDDIQTINKVLKSAESEYVDKDDFMVKSAII